MNFFCCFSFILKKLSIFASPFVPVSTAVDGLTDMEKMIRTIALFAMLTTGFCCVWGQNRVVISKPELKIFVLSEEGDTLYKAPVAVGRLYGQKHREDDWRTPEGKFKVKRIEPWLAKTEELAPFGGCFMLLDTPGFSGIGMHGTNNPKSIGTRCSHGCIRMYCDDARAVLKLVKVGTPVTILPDTVGVDASRKRNPITFSSVDYSRSDGSNYSDEVLDVVISGCEIKLSRSIYRKMGMEGLFED